MCETVWELTRITNDGWDSYDIGLFATERSARQQVQAAIAGLPGEISERVYSDGSIEITFHEVTPVRRLPRETHMWALSEYAVLR